MTVVKMQVGTVTDGPAVDVGNAVVTNERAFTSAGFTHSAILEIEVERV